MNNSNKNNPAQVPKTIVNITFYLSILIFIISFNFQDNRSGGWQLQTNLQTLLNGRTITDMTFIDSVTGFAVCSILTSTDTGYIFKTTNSGFNWFINYSNSTQFSNIFKKIMFVNDSIGFACGSGGMAFLCKTTDRGNSWIKTNYTWATGFRGMSILGKDTIYVVDDDGLVGGVFRSFNGGLNWQQIYNVSQYNPLDIYMINAQTGFYSQGNLYKTTNGGFSWTQLDNLGFRYMKFFDTLTGYRITNSNAYIQKTTDAGNNWVTFTIPDLPGIATIKNPLKLFFVGKDTFWVAGIYVWFPNPGRNRGVLYKTTNGGLNIGFQLPDTSFIKILRYYYINFYNNRIGWAYSNEGSGIHTTTGGDSTIYVGINQNTGIIPDDFILEQNYPNPFNAMTKIKFSIPPFNPPLIKGGRGLSSGGVSLKVYDILGKEVSVLVNESALGGQPGTYEVTFDASMLPSGIYFYRIETAQFTAVKKMVLIK